MDGESPDRQISPMAAGAQRRITGAAAARRLFECIACAPEEFAAIAYLARDRRLLGTRVIRGCRDSVCVAPRQLAIDALAFAAQAVVIAHNHPSGNPTPSAGDLAHARRAARALDAIDVELLDHLVLAGAETTSFRRLGLL